MLLSMYNYTLALKGAGIVIKNYKRANSKREPKG